MIANLLILVTLVLFPALMAFSASSDLFSMKISNRVSIALAVAYPLLAVGVGMPPPAILTNLGCGLLVLVITFTMFTRGWIGGGDAKLAASTAPWLGWALLLDYGLIASIVGGALTLAIVFSRRAPLRPWLLASAAGDLTDVVATAAGRRRLPRRSTPATLAVGGGSAMLSVGLAVTVER